MFRKKYGKRTAKKRFGGKKTSFKRAVTRARKSMFRKRVLRAVASTAETKVVNWRMVATKVAPVSSGAFDLSVYCISPSNLTYDTIPALGIYQGTGQGDRVGNKISPVSCTFRGVVRPYPSYDSIKNWNPGPMYVVLWVVSLAKHLDDTLSTLESVVYNSFYQNGNVSTGITGQLVDLTQTVNSAHVVVHKRRVMKIGYSAQAYGLTSGTSNTSYQNYANNDFSLTRMFSIRLKFPKSITFNDATANPSSMRRWWYFAVPYRADGNLFVAADANANGPTPLIVDFAVEMKFKDM